MENRTRIFAQYSRDVDDDKIADMKERGEKLFHAMYGETAGSVQTLLDAIHPDMGTLTAFSKIGCTCHNIFG